MNWRVGMSGVGQLNHVEFQRAGGSVGPVPLSTTAAVPVAAVGVGTWDAAIAANHLGSAPKPTTAPHRALLSRIAVTLPAVDKAAMLRLLPYARWAAATTPLTFVGLAVATFALDRWLNRQTGTSATAHSSVPVVESPKVVVEVYPAPEGPERLQGPLARPDHLPEVLRGGLDGQVVIGPEPQAGIHAGTRPVPMIPIGVDGFKQYVAQSGDNLYLSVGRGDDSGDQPDSRKKEIHKLVGDSFWALEKIHQITDPKALSRHPDQMLNDAINADPTIRPVNIAQNIQVYGANGSPRFGYMAYEPDLVVNGEVQPMVYPRLTKFNRHGFQAYYNAHTGHVDILMNSRSPVIHRADEVLGSDEQMMKAYLEKMASLGKGVDSISLRSSWLQTDLGRQFVKTVSSNMDRLAQAWGEEDAWQYANQKYQSLRDKGLLGSVAVLMRDGFSIVDVKPDQFGENWLHFTRD